MTATVAEKFLRTAGFNQKNAISMVRVSAG